MFAIHDSSTARRAVLTNLFISAVLVLLSTAIYWQTCGFSFVWDDDYFIVKNAAIRSWHRIPDYFTDVSSYSAGLYAPMYRPFRNLSFLLDYTWFGLKPAGWHLHNVLLHSANSVLVFFFVGAVLRLLAGSSESESSSVLSAAFAAALWCAHPVQTEAVAWVKERDELLFTLFAVGALLTAATGLLKPRISLLRHASILALVTAAILSKEMAITLPLLLACLAAFVSPARESFRKLLPSLVGAALICALFLLVRQHVIGRTSQVDSMSGSRYHDALTTVCAFARYVRLSVAPAQLIADYSGYPVVQSVLQVRFIIAALLLACIATAAFAMRRRAPLASFGIIFYFVSLLPVSNLVPTMQFLAERFLYFPLVGYAVVIAAAITWLQRILLLQNVAAVSRMLPASASLVYVAVLAYCALERLPDWKNDEALQTSTFQHAPPSSRIQLTRAAQLVSQGYNAEGLKLAREIEARAEKRFRFDDNPVLDRVLGVGLLRTGDTTSSLRYLQRSVELRPDDPSGLGALALYYGLTNDHRSAMKFYKQALDVDPQNKVLQRNYLLAMQHVQEETRVTKVNPGRK